MVSRIHFSLLVNDDTWVLWNNHVLSGIPRFLRMLFRMKAAAILLQRIQSRSGCGIDFGIYRLWTDYSSDNASEGPSTIDMYQIQCRRPLKSSVGGLDDSFPVVVMIENLNTSTKNWDRIRNTIVKYAKLAHSNFNQVAEHHSDPRYPVLNTSSTQCSAGIIQNLILYENNLYRRIFLLLKLIMKVHIFSSTPPSVSNSLQTEK